MITAYERSLENRHRKIHCVVGVLLLEHIFLFDFCELHREINVRTQRWEESIVLCTSIGFQDLFFCGEYDWGFIVVSIVTKAERFIMQILIYDPVILWSCNPVCLSVCKPGDGGVWSLVTNRKWSLSCGSGMMMGLVWGCFGSSIWKAVQHGFCVCERSFFSV